MSEKSDMNKQLREVMRRKVEKIRKRRIEDYKPDSEHKVQWGGRTKEPAIINPDMLVGN